MGAKAGYVVKIKDSYDMHHPLNDLGVLICIETGVSSWGTEPGATILVNDTVDTWCYTLFENVRKLSKLEKIIYNIE